MKTIVAINGSASPNSSNLQLLLTLQTEFAHLVDTKVFDGLWELPLFSPQREAEGIPDRVRQLRERVENADAVIISTPEYLHNIPAVLKSALEWMTHSGELADKPVLPITFTPHEPRGEYAMKSLLESLKASKARIVTELPLYRKQLPIENGTVIFDEDHRSLIAEAIKLL